jgi:hypothetical protein
MCVSCSANKCRIRESDLQAARLYIIFLNWYKPKFFQAIDFIVAYKKSDTKRHAATAQVGLINSEFQTACGFVGFTTQPTRRITFLCIPLYRAVWVLLGNACCKHTEAV